MDLILEARDVRKTYSSGARSVEVLKGVDFQMKAGETAAVVGPSGSGKTTLLSLCAGLDAPTSGEIRLLGQDVRAMAEDRRAVLRHTHLGFIFQSFHLMPSLTALENVLLPLELAGRRETDKARDLLAQVGLADRTHHYPAQLSGGEQQRVAIARAFINAPKLLFADEPTGNLDRETNHRIVDLLFDLNREQDATLLLITHDLDLAARAGRRFHLRDGRVFEDDQETSEVAEVVGVQ